MAVYVEWVRVPHGRVWHMVINTEASQPASALCEIGTAGHETVQGQPPKSARACRECLLAATLITQEAHQAAHDRWVIDHPDDLNWDAAVDAQDAS